MNKIKTKTTYRQIIWCIICLMPLLGGIVGIIILIKGLFPEKNKWFIIFGLMGILESIVIFFHLNYLQNHRGAFDESRIELAQYNMKQVLREIEFYKLNNSKYPENLEELHLQKHFIIDPLQQVNPTLSQKFFYRKVGRKYYFFSKGFDGIPFTTDDLFPSLNGIDPNKLGIIYRGHESDSTVLK